MRILQLSLLAIVAIIGATLGAVLFLAVWPYLQTIGQVATGFIVVLFGCAGVLAMAATYNLIGLLTAKRRRAILNSRVINYGDVVAVWGIDGNFTHLSAEHERAKIQPLQLDGPRVVTIEEVDVDYNIAQILEYWEAGQTLENIVEATGTPYNQVQRITKECANNNPEKLKLHNTNRSKLAAKR